MLASRTKAQKKVARTLIDLALERECAKLIRKVSKLSSKPLDDVEKPNHARYLELFKAIDSFDRRLQYRYDGITGGHYLETISYLYAEGILKEDDLDCMDFFWKMCLFCKKTPWKNGKMCLYLHRKSGII